MNVSEYIAQFFADKLAPCRAYGVSGGAAMYLNDAICHHPGIDFTAMHHEQAAAFAAEADARVSNKPAIVHVTAGPGVTNAMTGVACAYADSLPMIVIAGQVESRTLNEGGVRQLGISEVDGVALMKPITKFAVTVLDPEDIRFHLEQALYWATEGRNGPVYLEIPLDVQRAVVPDDLEGYPYTYNRSLKGYFGKDGVLDLLHQSQRPVILIGNGVRLAGADVEPLTELGIPILCSWSGADLISTKEPSYIGRPGLIGDRAGNYAIQNADVILAIGTRLSIPQIGHATELFAKNAKLIVVDIDKAELAKKTLRVDVPIHADAKEFLDRFYRRVKRQLWGDWLELCQDMRDHFPVVDLNTKPDGVQVYGFLKDLAEVIDDDAIIVTDVGQTFVCTHQAMPMTGRQRMFHSPGIAPMGYGLPAAIGACKAGGGRQVICLTGDGGTMFNLQELQTIVHHKLPIKIFIYENGGYKTMQTTQGNHFHRESVSSPESGVSFPDFQLIGEAFGIISYYNFHPEYVGDDGPAIFYLEIDRSQVIAPLVKTTIENGEFVVPPLDQMWPKVA